MFGRSPPNDLMQLFWEQEREPAAPVAFTPEEKRCEDLFTREHTRTSMGQYVVRLPFTGAPPSLAETCKPAERLLHAVERHCTKDTRFGNLYRNFMQEYEDLQHMEIINTSSKQEDTAKCYLPHHGVLWETSITTKLRIVFTARVQRFAALGCLIERHSTNGRQPPASSRRRTLLLTLASLCFRDGHREDIPSNPHPQGGLRPPADTLAAPCRRYPRIPPTNCHIWLGMHAISRHTYPTPARRRRGFTISAGSDRAAPQYLRRRRRHRSEHYLRGHHIAAGAT